MESLHTCMFCEAVCGIKVEHDGQRVTKVRGDDADVFSRGHICPKASALPDVMNDPDRVREPLRRKGTSWEPVSWESALEEAGARLAEVQARCGRHALGLYMGNPTVHSSSAILAGVVFSRALNTRSRFSATSVDQLPQMLAALKMFGHQLLLPIPDVDRTQFFLVLGANPLASNGSLMTAGGIGPRLKELKARGGRLVVVDPRRTETASIATQHLAIRPGGDAAFLLAVLQVIFGERLARPGRLAEFTDGLEELEMLVKPWAPERVEAATGLPAEVVRRLAREFASSPSAVAYCRMGASTQEFGGLASWLTTALNVVTGNLDRAGGAMFTTPAADLVTLTSRMGDRGGFARWKSRVRGLPEFGGELPTATLAEEMETPGDGQVRALITMAGNPVLSSPNGARLERALAGLDFMVSIDLYRNETTRHANLILPTSFGLEREHFDAVFYLLAVRNVARWVNAVVPPPPGVRHDWQVMLGLAEALRRHGGGRPGLPTTLGLQGLKQLGPRRLVDGLLRVGPRGTSVRALEKSPHGIDFGALEPRLPGRLAHRDQRIVLVPDVFKNDLPRLERALSNPTTPLVLIGRRSLRSNNSWLHNSERLTKGPDACTVLVHPNDAKSRGLTHGGLTRVRTRTGQLEVRVTISDEVAEGVACLPHGFGHSRAGAQLSVASTRPGISLNDLTDDLRVDELTGNAAFSGTPVELEPATEKTP